MSNLDSKKAIADFKKKHLDAARERWVKAAEVKAKRLPKPKLDSLVEALNGKKKADSEEEPIHRAVDQCKELAEEIEKLGKLGKTFTELRTHTKPAIDKIDTPVAGAADVFKLLAACITLWYVAKKEIEKLEKSKS